MGKITLLVIITFLYTSCIIENIIPENTWNISDVYDKNNNIQVIKEEGREFTILQLTDMHIGSYIMDDYSAVKNTLDMVREAIEISKPDMLLLTGDNIIATGVINTLWAERLIVFLDSFKIPYILVMGNHDGGGFFDTKNINRKQIVADIFASGKYSLFNKGPINIGGIGNYCVDIIKENGEILFSIIVLDNGDNDFTAKQLAWYEWHVINLSELTFGTYAPDEGKVIKTFLSYHRPLYETYSLWKEIQANDPALAAEFFGESPSIRKTNSGMFAKIKELKSTSHMFFGHDHRNMLYYQFQGIYFVYGLKTGTSSDYVKNKQGTTLITVKDDLTVSVNFLHR